MATFADLYDRSGTNMGKGAEAKQAWLAFFGTLSPDGSRRIPVAVRAALIFLRLSTKVDGSGVNNGNFCECVRRFWYKSGGWGGSKARVAGSFRLNF